MFHFHLIHVNYLILGVIGLVFLAFLWIKWDFISKACSDGSVPSMTRLCGFMFSIMVCFNEVYTTLETMEFDIDHLKFDLLMIGLLFGFIKIVDVVSIWRGVAPTAPSKDEEIKS